MREVRWVLQAASPGTERWVEQSDRVYSGWFYSGGVQDVPIPVVSEYETAVKELTWLDVRLVQETRSFQRTVLREVKREKDDKQT